MPGPVSDSYDPEFSTGANANAVREGIEEVVTALTEALGPELRDIVEVAYGGEGRSIIFKFTERTARLARFGLLRAIESI